MTNNKRISIGQLSIDDDGNYFFDGKPVGDEATVVTQVRQLVEEQNKFAAAEALHHSMCRYGERCEICTAWADDEKKAAAEDLKVRINDVHLMMRGFTNEYSRINQPSDADIDRVLMLVAQRMNGEEMPYED